MNGESEMNKTTGSAPEKLPALRDALRDLLDYVDGETCTHEETHRGGAIWTICDGCGRKWADDEGGFVPHQDAPAVAKARAMLEALRAEAAPLAEGREGYERMFYAACDSLGRIGHDLGIDPSAGGHGLILAAIAELRAERDGLMEVCRSAYKMIHDEPVDFAILGEMLYQATRGYCADCNGSGEVVGLVGAHDPQDSYEAPMECPKCEGTGATPTAQRVAAGDGPDSHAFKNFHRALCERFGYPHDEIDWRRDQVSLIEHIAASPPRGAEPFGWWVVCDAAEGGKVGQFARDWSFIETVRSHIPTTEATPLYTHPAAQADAREAAVRKARVLIDHYIHGEVGREGLEEAHDALSAALAAPVAVGPDDAQR